MTPYSELATKVAFAGEAEHAVHGEERTIQQDDLELLDAYSRAVIRVVDDVSPSVVHISRLEQISDPRHPRRGSWAPAGSGSGVILTPDGYLLTNAHVVHGAARLEVGLSGGRKLIAGVVGED